MSAAKRKKSARPSFEERLKQLQEIVAKLEEGDLPLLESIERYREGIEALKACRALLEDAQTTVEILTREASEQAPDEELLEEEEEDD